MRNQNDVICGGNELLFLFTHPAEKVSSARGVSVHSKVATYSDRGFYRKSMRRQIKIFRVGVKILFVRFSFFSIRSSPAQSQSVLLYILFRIIICSLIKQ